MLGIGNEAAGFMYIKLKRKSSIVNSMELIWRHHPESNRRWRFCRPLPYRLAMVPFGRVKGGNAAVKKWSGKRGSNPPPPPWQGGALPNELFPQHGASEWSRTTDTGIFSPLLYQLSYRGKMAIRRGLEPLTSSVTGWHSNQLNYRTAWWEQQGSNL